jgi:hypothetical protein
MVSKFSRRFGTPSRLVAVSLVLFAVVLAAVPAFGSSVGPVSVRVEGASRTLFNRVIAVNSTTITDSSAATHAVDPSPMAALAAAARLGGFPYVAKNYSGWGLYLGSVAGDVATGSAGWLYRVNGASLPFACDQAPLAAGDRVLWYYGTYDASPTVVVPASTLLRAGQILTVTAEQLDMDGVASPLAGATVHVGSRTAVSKANGTATFLMSAAGRYSVRAEKAGCIRSAVVSVKVRKRTAFRSLAVSDTGIEVGARSIVSATLVSGATRLGGRRVRLWRRVKGTAKWVPGQFRKTGSAGRVRFRVMPLRSTYYRFVFAGDGSHAPVASTPVLVAIR